MIRHAISLIEWWQVPMAFAAVFLLAGPACSWRTTRVDRRDAEAAAALAEATR